MKIFVTIVLACVMLVSVLSLSAFAVNTTNSSSVATHSCNVCGSSDFTSLLHSYSLKPIALYDDLGGDDPVDPDPLTTATTSESINLSITTKKDSTGNIQVTLSIPTTYMSTAISSGHLKITYNSMDMKYDSWAGSVYGINVSTLLPTVDETTDPLAATIDIELPANSSGSLYTLSRLTFTPVSLTSASDRSVITVTGYGISNLTSTESIKYVITNSLTFAYCSHTRTYAIDTIPATCSREGVRTTYCEDCQLKISETYTPRSDHSYSTKPARVLKAPTCTQEGQGEFVCTVCHQTGYAKIPATGHTFGAPILRSDGKYYETCLVCGFEQLANKQCSHPDSSYELFAISEEATCTKEGTAIYVCKECGKQKTVTLPKLSHTWIDIEIITEASETQLGLKKQRCSVCGLVQNNEYSLHTTHDFSGREVIVSQPTCEKEGLKRVYCTGCEQFEERTIPALGHSFGDWVVKQVGSCTQSEIKERKCSTCGYTEQQVKEAVGHVYGDWVTTVSPTCTQLGRRVATCTACGNQVFEDIPMLSHVFDSANYKVITNPTCTSTGLERCVCTTCGIATNDREVPIDPNAHSFSNWMVVEKATCVTEGLSSRTCVFCGKSETRIDPKVGHTFTELTEKGVTTKTCSVCGAVETFQMVKDVKTVTVKSGVIRLTVTDVTKTSKDIFFLANLLSSSDSAYKDYVAPYETALVERQQSIISAYEYELKYGESEGNLQSADKVEIVLSDDYSKVDVKVWYVSQSGSLLPVNEANIKRSKNTITIKGVDSFANASDVIILTNAGTYNNSSIALPITIAVVTIVIVVGLVFFLRYREKKNSKEIKDEDDDE